MIDPVHTPAQLREWWVTRAGEDIDSVMEKVIEYGAGDLEAIGQELAKMHPSGTFDNPIELGLVFYLLGKITRATSAIAAGHLPSADTIKDIKVYGGMLDYARQHGLWGVITGRDASNATWPTLKMFTPYPEQPSIFDAPGYQCHAEKSTDSGLMECALARGHDNFQDVNGRFGHITKDGVMFSVPD